MITRRTLLAASTGAAGALSVAGCDDDAGEAQPPRQDETRDREARHGPVVASFVSTPDFFNGDVADLSTLSNWDGGLNSINESWRTAIDKCLAAVARHRPEAVFVAGDLVEGRWNIDSDGRGLFGQVSQESDAASLAACRTAISRAASAYYGHYTEMFASRGLRLLPAVGDHELLDDRRGATVNDRWSPLGKILVGSAIGEPDNRYHLVPHCKSTWADHFTTRADGSARYPRRPIGSAAERTAYAVDLGPQLTLITVDVFNRTPRGVELGVVGRQLTWLRRTIRAAKKQGRVVIVQGHVPILRPYRKYQSGGLYVPGAKNSPMFRAMKDEGVDFYFCGEVHDTSARQQDGRGPVQVCHGSIFRYAFNYLHGRVHADGTTVLDYYEMTVKARSEEREIWSADAIKRQSTILQYGDAVHQGTLATRRGRITERTGKLLPFKPEDDTRSYANTLDPTIL